MDNSDVLESCFGIFLAMIANQIEPEFVSKMTTCNGGEIQMHVMPDGAMHLDVSPEVFDLLKVQDFWHTTATDFDKMLFSGITDISSFIK